MSDRIKDELRKLSGKYCFFNESTLFIRNESDSKIVGVEDDYLVIEHCHKGLTKNSISVISRIERHDLESSDRPNDTLLYAGAKEGSIEEGNVSPEGSQSIDRAAHPGKSDAEIAEAIATKYGYVAVVRYKNSSTAREFTNFGTCQTEDKIRGYLSSPYCHDAEVVYDGRSTALRVTEDLILTGKCELCGKRTTQESLQLMAGNDFYVCPICGLMCCDCCYAKLPLTSSPGYGTCPKCRVEVQRAIPGFYGKQSGSPPPNGGAQEARASSEVRSGGGATQAESEPNATQRRWWQFWKER